MKQSTVVKRLAVRRAVYDALREQDKQGRKRPGSLKR